jgi:hypothetical protein
MGKAPRYYGTLDRQDLQFACSGPVYRGKQTASAVGKQTATAGARQAFLGMTQVAWQRRQGPGVHAHVCMLMWS